MNRFVFFSHLLSFPSLRTDKARMSSSIGQSSESPKHKPEKIVPMTVPMTVPPLKIPPTFSQTFWVRSSQTGQNYQVWELGNPKVLVELCTPTAVLPSRATLKSAGLDLSSDQAYVIKARGQALVSTGLKFLFPEGVYGRLATRSGQAHKHGLNVGAGVIDADYEGVVKVVIFNHSDQDYVVSPKDRIAQLILEKYVIAPIYQVVNGSLYPDTTATTNKDVRGNKGFGSTGTGHDKNVIPSSTTIVTTANRPSVSKMQ